MSIVFSFKSYNPILTRQHCKLKKKDKYRINSESRNDLPEGRSSYDPSMLQAQTE
jgi:hypothetical protein